MSNNHTILCQITLPRSRGGSDVQNALDAFGIHATVEPFGDGKLPDLNTRRGRRAIEEQERQYSLPSTTCDACDTECPGFEFWQYLRGNVTQPAVSDFGKDAVQAEKINLCDDCHEDASGDLEGIDLDADILDAEDFARLKQWIADENSEL